METAQRPTNIGILAAEIYVPTRYVSQEDLETADGCAGKYTIGLGQVAMAFTDDREDITSIIMTAVQSLMEKHNINPADVGRLEVGTETLIDKAKSVKTSLMPLFGENTDIEGITTINACYGGTAALFNTVAWVESSDYDGRYAILVCADIAVYAKGNARPTGGCAAIAMLIGPNAPLALESGVRASHFLSVYDFYKPHHSEYAAVDGKLSQWAYLSSVDKCYSRYVEKCTKKNGIGADIIDLSHFDYFAFHSPYNKLAQKGFARLYYVDFMNKLKTVNGDKSSPVLSDFAAAIPFSDVPQEDSYDNRDVENAFKSISSDRFKSSLVPSCLISRNIGNSYTASVFCGVVTLLGSFGPALVNKRILAFSYGSGSAASVYSYIGRVPTADVDAYFGIPVERRRVFSLQEIQSGINIEELLQARRKCTTEEFNLALDMREHAHGKAPWTPVGDLNDMRSGAYYLTSIDEKHRRSYERKA